MTEKILITGVSGFVGSHCAAEFLRQGYQVRGTLRDLSRAGPLKVLFRSVCPDGLPIELVCADLLDNSSWRAAVEGCSGIIHTASPVLAVEPIDPEVLVQPAVQGTRSILNAALLEGIGRVVLTSSIEAVTGGKTSVSRQYHPSDWTDPTIPGLSAYALSKTLAESLAWSIARREKLDLTVVNPGLILGPALEPDYGQSLELIARLLRGGVPILPKLGFEIVDVRDVALLHRLAYENDAAIGERLFCGAGFRWFKDVARVLAEGFPSYRRQIPRYELPNMLLRLFATFFPEVAAFAQDGGKVLTLDCSLARQIGWAPRNPEQAILDAGQSLIDLGVLQERSA